MSITFDADDPRTIQALELAADAGQWLVCRTRDGRHAFGVPARSSSGRYYLVSHSACDCPEFRAQRRQACTHMLAVRLHTELIKAVQEQGRPAAAPRRGHLRLVASKS